MPFQAKSEARSVEDVPIAERETLPPPTVPEPKASEVRLRTRIEYASAVVDVVTADLTRDPRSEDWQPRDGEVPADVVRAPRVPPHVVLPPRPDVPRVLAIIPARTEPNKKPRGKRRRARS